MIALCTKVLTIACWRTDFPLRSKPAANAGVEAVEKPQIRPFLVAPSVSLVVQLAALVQGLPWQRLGADGVISIL